MAIAIGMLLRVIATSCEVIHGNTMRRLVCTYIATLLRAKKQADIIPRPQACNMHAVIDMRMRDLH